MVMLFRQASKVFTVSLLGLGLGSIELLAWGSLSPACAEDTFYAATTAASLRQIQSTLLDLDQVPPGMTPDGESIVPSETLGPNQTITHESLSEKTMTTPSLWWQRMQTSEFIGTDRLILGWSAVDREGHGLDNIDVTVNSQIWNLLNYLEQYSFIHQFGQTAKAYGYQLRIFSGPVLTGAYACNFSQVTPLDFTNDQTLPPAQLNEIACSVSLDYLGRGGIRGSRL